MVVNGADARCDEVDDDDAELLLLLLLLLEAAVMWKWCDEDEADLCAFDDDGAAAAAELLPLVAAPPVPAVGMLLLETGFSTGDARLLLLVLVSGLIAGDDTYAAKPAAGATAVGLLM